MFMLTLLGFAADGVVKGSIAAGIQSVFYGGFTTGLFSIFQSWGALALLWEANTIDTFAAHDILPWTDICTVENFNDANNG